MSESEKKSPTSSAYQEMQDWLERLKSDSQRLRWRNRVLRVLFGVGLLLFLLGLWKIHAMTLGKYAVLKHVEITQNPCSQGQIDIVFEVTQPGRVYCRRTCGDAQTDLIDEYREPGVYRRPWSWTYRPGQPIEVSLWSRSWGMRVCQSASFSTADRMDIVILIDATGSMDESLKELKDKCALFAEKLKTQSLQPRFALIGFGDTGDGEWVEIHDFTDDVTAFAQSVEKIRRFDGGDLPESALDALVEALRLVEKSSTPGNVRRFYLVTDESFHEKTADGKFDTATVGKLLVQNGVLLDVFCRPQYRKNYEPLLGEWGNFLEIENFGKALAEGRVLED
ncbi:MAG: vWA domain-containing protein [Planctomycetia bacterium]|nr:vWA domain-containing protein [Planctomycetia bacterium]